MSSAFLISIGRGAGWLVTTIAACLLGVIIGILPLILMPGPVQTDFVHGKWIKLAALIFAGAMLTWRLSPMRGDIRLSPTIAGKFIWPAVTSFVLIFWPLGLAVWFNAHDARLKGIHDMIVTDLESTTVRPGVTPIRSFDLREASTGWTVNLEVTDQREQQFKPGRCVRITVRAGRLGLDWISDAKPITCPTNVR